MHIGILQCDWVDTAMQPEFGDYPAMHEHLLRAAAGQMELTFSVYNLTAEQFPASPHACDAWVVTGSKWSAYDADDWIARAHEFVRALHAELRPTIGICFGHQLIARALGGRVAKAEVGWGVGVHTTNIVARQPWMTPHRDALALLVSHQDQVVEPPAGATLLAGHAFCPHDMFVIGDHMLTLQGHPEFPKGFVRAVMDKRRDILGESVYLEGIASLQQPVEADVAGAWLLAFLQRAVAS